MISCETCMNYAVCDDDDKDCGICGVFESKPTYHKQTPYERTRAQVYATGNKWAIENFNATHN